MQGWETIPQSRLVGGRHIEHTILDWKRKGLLTDDVVNECAYGCRLRERSKEVLVMGRVFEFQLCGLLDGLGDGE